MLEASNDVTYDEVTKIRNMKLSAPAEDMFSFAPKT